MKKIFIMQALFLLAFIIGCDSTEYREYSDTVVKIDESDITFTAAGGTGSIAVAQTEGAITATVDKSWCTLNTAGKTISLTVAPNMSVSGRTAMVTVKSGNKANYVSITQTAVSLSLDAYTATVEGKIEDSEEKRIGYESIGIVSATTSATWLATSVDEQTHEIVLEVIADNPSASIRTTNVTVAVEDGNGNTLMSYNIVVTQGGGDVGYADFLGDYTMTFSNTYNSATPSFTIDVSLVQKVEGASFYLKGVLQTAYDSNFPITVTYDASTKVLSLLAQPLGYNTANSKYINLCVTRSETNSYIYNATYGLISSGISFATGKLSFQFTDNGNWTSYTIIGFSFRYCDAPSSTTGAATAAIGNGSGDDIRYYFMSLQKK